jgi:hypothetical protein
MQYAYTLAPVVLETRLTKNSCSMHDLWKEYKFCFVLVPSSHQKIRHLQRRVSIGSSISRGVLLGKIAKVSNSEE